MTHDANNNFREIGISIAAKDRAKRDCRRTNASNCRNIIEPDRT